MKSELMHYNEFDLLNIRIDSPQELDGVKEPLIRVEMPSNPIHYKSMVEHGFVFGDRTLGVSINLKRSKIDYGKLVRFKMRKLSDSDGEDRNEVLRIAKESFPTDRRFHVWPEYDDRVAGIVLEKWISELNNTYLCLSKENIAGFIDIVKTDNDTCYIHLAAVEKKYRAAGASMSMYAFAVEQAILNGYSKVTGRISSTNTAVMNLYAFLGGSFGEPIDVYLRKG